MTDFYKARQLKFALTNQTQQSVWGDTAYNHIQSACLFLDPHTTFAFPLWTALLTTAASAIAPVACGGQVLVDGAAVGDETHAQLEVSSQSAVCSESQNQQRGEQQKAHDQHSHAAGVIQQVWTIQRCSMWLHLESERQRYKGWMRTSVHTKTFGEISYN